MIANVYVVHCVCIFTFALYKSSSLNQTRCNSQQLVTKRAEWKCGVVANTCEVNPHSTKSVCYVYVRGKYAIERIQYV